MSQAGTGMDNFIENDLRTNIPRGDNVDERPEDVKKRIPRKFKGYCSKVACCIRIYSSSQIHMCNRKYVTVCRCVCLCRFSCLQRVLIVEKHG